MFINITIFVTAKKRVLFKLCEKIKMKEMRKRIKAISLIFITFCLMSNILKGQEAQADSLQKNALRVFLDCRSCDMNYTREQIPYINYVRDVKEAQVYILVTQQNSGSGGNLYTYTFKGQQKFKGMSDTLICSTSPDETSTIIRDRRTTLLKMGLMRYIAKTPLSEEFSIRHTGNYRTVEVVDRWNNWVFELQTSPRFNAEQSYNRLYFSNSIEIRKITPDIKLEIELDQSTNRQKYKQDDGTTNLYIRNAESIRTMLVKSLGDHWSAGVKVDLMAATNPNYDMDLQIMPAIEYDLFPYSEATHRQLRINYSIGNQSSNYIDSTIFNKMKESLFLHQLRVAYQIQEKWGSVNVSLTGSNYFHDWSKNKILLDGYIRLRILKGLSLSVNGGVGYINDQLNLRKGDISEAERLLRLKEQATNFSIQGGLSITYTFGSIYNNVVNPRFGNGGGGGGGGGGFY
jgi:hypothetical protein